MAYPVGPFNFATPMAAHSRWPGFPPLNFISPLPFPGLTAFPIASPFSFGPRMPKLYDSFVYEQLYDPSYGLDIKRQKLLRPESSSSATEAESSSSAMEAKF